MRNHMKLLGDFLFDAALNRRLAMPLSFRVVRKKVGLFAAPTDVLKALSRLPV